ncbi:MAG: hypothetical protein ACE5Q5_07735, partial [Nitrosarchaeum sp.]
MEKSKKRELKHSNYGIKIVMSQDEAQKKSIKEHSDKLAKLGMKLSEGQFSYKLEEKTSKEYWQKKIENFKKYSKNGLEYYNQIFSLMKVVNQEEAQLFLLRISKFNQMSSKLIEKYCPLDDESKV